MGCGASSKKKYEDQQAATPAAEADASKAAKADDAKPADAKPADAKPVDAPETKPVDAKPEPAEAKPAEAKPAEAKPADAAETKQADAAEAKQADAAEAKPADAAEEKPADAAEEKPADAAEEKPADAAPADSEDFKKLVGAGTDLTKNAAWMQATLELHNALRAKHGAPPLEWSEECAEKAQIACNNCVEQGMMFHSSHEEFGHGQNAFAGTSGSYGAKEAVEAWYNELTDPGYTWPGGETGCEGCGHFTQVVWKDCAKVGMACDTSGQGYIVANYWPAGNMQGSFQKQVFPLDTPMQSRLQVRTTPYTGVVTEEDDDVKGVLDTLESAGQQGTVDAVREKLAEGGWQVTIKFEPNPGGTFEVTFEKDGAMSMQSCTF